MSRKAPNMSSNDDCATMPSGERVAYSRAYLLWRNPVPPKADGRVAANQKRHAARYPVIKRVPAEKGAAIRALLPPDLAERSAKAETFVYFARDGLEIKIGLSKDVRKRVTSLQTARSDLIHVEYVVRGGRELEAYLHLKFKNSRLHGEWFRYHGEVQAFLSGLPYDENEWAIKL